jgi:hypothetical protein
MSPKMPKLDIVCDLGIIINMDNSWMSWTLDIKIILVTLVESDFSWTQDQFHWKFFLVLFPYIYRISKSDAVCVVYINLKLKWSLTLSWTRSQTL